MGKQKRYVQKPVVGVEWVNSGYGLLVNFMTFLLP